MHSNVRNELRNRTFYEIEVNEITDDIVGKQIGSTFCEGLIDAESEEVLYHKLEEKKSRMEEKGRRQSYLLCWLL